MITKNQLLQEANLALENNACLLLKAGVTLLIMQRLFYPIP